jgi:reverse gyrase
MSIHSIYKRLCVNCGGEIDDYRASMGLPCSKCLPDTLIGDTLTGNTLTGDTLTGNTLIGANLTNTTSNEESKSTFPSVVDLKKLLNVVKPGNLKEIFQMKEKIEEVSDIFKKAIGSSPWNVQISWIKRVILGRSFSLVAPTGVGKTTFGLITALALAKEGKKSIIILPTTNLVDQAYEKLKLFSKKTEIKANIQRYSSKIKEKEKKEFRENIKNGNFDIVIITSSMVKNLLEISENLKFDFTFADDVDALLKQSKNIEHVIRLTGVPKEYIDKSLELIKTKFILAVSKDTAKKEEYLNKYKEILEETEKLRDSEKGVIVLSSATAKPRGARVKLFREIFNFEIGIKSEFSRNIGNYYLVTNNEEDELIKLINKLGDGGLVFTPVEKGVEYAIHISNLINKKTNYKSKVISSLTESQKEIENFKKGKLNILVGVATYYGSLVRGIDIPDRIIYTIFVNFPKFRVPLKIESLKLSPYQIIKIISEILPYEEDQKKRKQLESLVRRLRRNQTYQPLIEEGNKIIKTILEDKKYLEILKNSSDILIEENEDKTLEIIIPDINTYIQGSGRCSRLYPGGMTRGISVIIENNQKLMNVASKRHQLIEDTEWLNLEESEEKIQEDLKKAKEDRESLKKVLRGEASSEIKLQNKTVLIIVESPTKAKTISRMFGNPTERVIKGLSCYEVNFGNITFIVTASKGHIFELTTDKEDIFGLRVMNNIVIPVYDTIKRCPKCGRAFVSTSNTCIYCGNENINDRYKDLVSLIELAKEVDEVLISSDPDTEGEKIGFDIFLSVLPYLKVLNGDVKRMRFNEVTYSAIRKAVESPTDINKKLVESQLLRRIQDRLIGFGLSNILQEKFDKENLSAGRAQSPVLGWIIERYKEYNNSKSTFCELELGSNGTNLKVSIEAKKDEIKLKVGDKVNVKKVEEKKLELEPLPPFTTDTILSFANKYYKMSSNETMEILQELFEEGLITYHRTESTTVSLTGQKVAEEYLSEKAKELFQPRSWTSEGAHECIRPTKPIDRKTLEQMIYEGLIDENITRRHLLIYEAIFKRFIASQMKKSIVKNVSYEINLNGKTSNISRNVKIIEPGWTMIGYLQIEEELDETLEVKSIKFVRKPKTFLFSESDIIQLMKEKGIGRPSTYAKIIQTLLQRRYVISKNNKLIPTSLGIQVYEQLLKDFEDFISEERTQYIEKMMDEVEEGKKEYFSSLSELLEEFNSKIKPHIKPE